MRFWAWFLRGVSNELLSGGQYEHTITTHGQVRANMGTGTVRGSSFLRAICPCPCPSIIPAIGCQKNMRLFNVLDLYLNIYFITYHFFACLPLYTLLSKRSKTKDIWLQWIFLFKFNLVIIEKMKTININF